MTPKQNKIKSLAIQEAQTQNTDVRIVLATIQAESDFKNILGDNGNALGPGQVWPHWHNDAFIYAANRFGIAWPSDLSSQQTVVLDNANLAVAAAVRVIKKDWDSSGHNFHSFTLSYVGPHIPQSDYDRRYKIWLQYQNITAAETVTQPTKKSFGSPATQKSNENQITFPETNYSVVANSQRTGNILYGRRYRVLVSDSQGTVFDVSDVRCTFTIQRVINQTPPFSEITLYNLAPDTEYSVLTEGNRIIIEAGYEGEQYGVIFDGDIVQTIRDKQDSTTYRLMIYALDGDRMLNQGFVNFTVNKGQSARQIAGHLSEKSTMPTTLGNISSGLSENQLTRGKTFFGMTRDYFRQLSQSQNATYYVENGKLHLIQAPDVPKDEVIDLTPDSGLIGVPAQQQLGVSFKSLLNPKMKINNLVHIDNSLIRAETFQIGQVMRNLDKAGLYRICGITHTGDTRGESWYTACTSVSQAGGIPGIMNTVTANPWGG